MLIPRARRPGRFTYSVYKLLLCSALLSTLSSCNGPPKWIHLPAEPDGGSRQDASLSSGRTCKAANTSFCDAGKFVQCNNAGEFIERHAQDCAARGLVCDAALGCIACMQGDRRCKACPTADPSCVARVQTCDASTHTWVDAQSCNQDNAEICRNGQCVNACDAAERDHGYVGCEFYAVDLDNAAISDTLNAAAQQYAVVVANPQPVSVEVRVKQNDAAWGKPVSEAEVTHVVVPPGDLETIKLPARHVDGSSPTGLNDGTNSAQSSHAYRIQAKWPIIAYQFNPLENVHVFSNDASLLLPTAALGTRYTVASWGQTIAHGDSAGQSFDGTSTSDTLRSFLTIVGTKRPTHVTVDLGPSVVKVLGAGPLPEGHPGDRLSVDIGPFDVVNLETDGFNADFTGSVVNADQPIGVFAGSESSDVPMYSRYTQRQCCADHLEEQLLPDAALGSDFVVAHQASRSAAVNRASQDGQPLVAQGAEPEWTRVVSVSDTPTQVTTTLAPPDDAFTLAPKADAILKATQDFHLHADHPVSVITLLPSQQVTGIPSHYPGGDPSLLVVPPTEQYRKDYVFLTPDTYAFNFVEIVAPKGAELALDGSPLAAAGCEAHEVPTLEAASAVVTYKAGPHWQTYSCQLSFPTVVRGTTTSVLPGARNTGVHTLVANVPVGIVVSGFDRFVSYAYVGGLNLDVLN